MNQTDFRIGNFIKYKDKFHVITDFTLHCIKKQPKNYERIKINTDWLLGFGFVEKYPLGDDFTTEEYTFRVFKIDDFEIEIDLSNNTFKLNNYTNIGLLDYEFVDTLQNLYYFLKGKELIFS